MKKNLIAGFLGGIIFFVLPTLPSGSYGFFGYENLAKTFPFIEGSFLLTSATLLIFYMIISLPIFILYSLFFIRKKHGGENQKTYITSFLVFYVGFIMAFLAFLTIGLIGASRGGFGL